LFKARPDRTVGKGAAIVYKLAVCAYNVWCHTMYVQRSLTLTLRSAGRTSEAAVRVEHPVFLLARFMTPVIFALDHHQQQIITSLPSSLAIVAPPPFPSRLAMLGS
jgi:hypothetical protein